MAFQKRKPFLLNDLIAKKFGQPKRKLFSAKPITEFAMKLNGFCNFTGFSNHQKHHSGHITCGSELGDTSLEIS